MTLHFAYPFVLYILTPLLCLTAGYVFYHLNKRFFRYPRANSMALHGLGIGKKHKYVLILTFGEASRRLHLQVRLRS